MTCFHPIDGWRSKYPNAAGKFPVVFSFGPDCGESIRVPCCKCIGCRLEKKRVWAVRMMHESQTQFEIYGKLSSFITLTYSDEYLPMYGSLVKEDVQKFVKRLRRKIAPEKISYYMSGEYGTTCKKHEIEKCPECGPLQRPHYHGIIFGFEFPDKEEVGSRDGETVYTSDLLSDRWEFGSHEIGSVTFESCAYVAGYIVDKIDGDQAWEHYERHIIETDQLVQIAPEFGVMSNGLGEDWFTYYWDDCYPEDKCPVPGRYAVGKPPRYYDKLMERKDPVLLDSVKEERVVRFKEREKEGPSLASREKCAKARVDRKRRSL